MSTQIIRPKKQDNGVSVWTAGFNFLALAVEIR
jgi:hypothetical protein